MRLLLLAVSLSTLAASSVWALTQGPLAPADAAFTSRISVGAGDGAAARPAVAERSPVRERLTYETYAVTGETAEAVLRSLVDLGPRDGGDVFFGLTQTELDVRYEPTGVSGGCRIESVEVDLNVVVTLPEWEPEGAVDSALRHDWSRFRRSLSQHELRHREIARSGAEAAAAEVAGFYRSLCPAAIAEARERLDRLGVEINGAHRRYDDETGHGKTEGAVWPIQ